MNGYNVYWGGDPNGTSADYIAAEGYTPLPVPTGSTRYLRLRTRDAAGNAAGWVTLFKLKYDSTPPSLALTHPADGLHIGYPELWIKGYAQDGASGSGTISVRALPANFSPSALLDASGVFTAGLGSAALRPGQNTLVITAVDLAGNATTLTRIVYYDPGGPVISEHAPVGATGQARPTISALFSVTGTAVISPASALIQVDGLDVTQEAAITGAGLSYIPAQALAEGPHAVRVQVRDLAGNRAQTYWGFTVDLSTQVTLTRPRPDAVLNTQQLAIEGLAEAGAAIVLAVNGVTAGEVVAEGGTFRFDDVPLVVGGNTLAVTATDGLGHTATITRAVTVDLSSVMADVQAEPAIFSPGGCVNRTHFQMRAIPPAGEQIAAWRLQVSGGTQTTSWGDFGAPPANVEWDGANWPEGDYLYTLAVTATNGLTANTPPQVVRLTRSPAAAPVIRVPAGPIVTTAWQVWLAGEAEPGSTVTLLDGGYFTTTLTQTIGLDGQWATHYPLHGGVNQIWAIAGDAACQASLPSNVIQVTHQAQPPLYSVGVTPTTVGGGGAVSLWATARERNLLEGARTSTVWSRPPDGQEVALALTSGVGSAVGLWSGSWSATEQPSGDYPVFFEGVDEDGVRGRGEVGLAVRNSVAAPVITWPSSPSYTADPRVKVAGRVQDGDLSLRLHLDGAQVSRQELGPSLAWQATVTLTGEGTHTLVAYATDRFGQVSAPSLALHVVLDTAKPTVSAAAWWPAHSDLINVTWTVTETGSGLAGCDVDVAVDGGEFAPWLVGVAETSATYAGERGRGYVFRVRARDRAGNEGVGQAAVAGKTVRKYYALGGRRVAMRANSVVYYLYSDHLGSTTLVTDDGGRVIARQLYYPYGAVRYTEGTLPTDYTFTGQRADADTGLMYYKARFYHPYLNRFAQADSIVPNPTNPQLLNRYSYAGNSPIVYNDPDGHCGPLCIALAGGLVLGLAVGIPLTRDIYSTCSAGVPCVRIWMGGTNKWRDFSLGSGSSNASYAAADANALGLSGFEIVTMGGIFWQGYVNIQRFAGNYPEKGYIDLGGSYEGHSWGPGQIRPEEAREAGGEGGADLFDQRQSIYYMTHKLHNANDAISKHSNVSPIDRFMLLSISQCDRWSSTQEAFFGNTIKRDWSVFLAANPRYAAILREMLASYEWLVYREGWQLPEGVSLDEYRQRLESPAGGSQ